MVLKFFGSLFQAFGLLFFLIFSVGVGALGLYTLLTGHSAAQTELGNSLTVLSFIGAAPLGFLLVGFALVKNENGTSYFPNASFELFGRLVIVPISIALSASLAIIMVPFVAYRYFQYRKGVMSGTIQFIRWASFGWYITLPVYLCLVLGTLLIMI